MKHKTKNPISELHSNFGDAIIMMRRNCRLTQTEFAKKFEVGLKTIQNWESGQIMPRINDLDKFTFLAQEQGYYFGNQTRYKLKESRPSPLTIEELMDRLCYCSEVFVTKSGGNPLCCENGEVQNMLLTAMRGGVQFHFVYFPQDGYSSCSQLLLDKGIEEKLKMNSHEEQARLNESIKVLIQRHAIPNQDVAKSLGLSFPWTSYVTGFYNQDGAVKYNKSDETWTELSETTQRLRVSIKTHYFMRMGEDESSEYLWRVRPIIDKLSIEVK